MRFCSRSPDTLQAASRDPLPRHHPQDRVRQDTAPRTSQGDHLMPCNFLRPASDSNDSVLITIWQFPEQITGTACPKQFRNAPLWGLGQRLFFLHDGREPKNPPVANQSPLFDTIMDHCLPVPSGSTFPTSEACAVVANFTKLPVNSVCPSTSPNCNCNTSACTASQEDLMHFLRSL